MARRPSTQPTEVEMQILTVLWARGEATMRDVCDDLSLTRRVTPSGIATILKIMVNKDLARVTDERRPQKFTACRTKDDTFSSILTQFTQQSKWSIGTLVRAALGTVKPTKADVDEVKRLLDEHEAKGEAKHEGKADREAKGEGKRAR